MAARELVCGDRFLIKKQTAKSVVIEGWANRAVLDRGKEIIFKQAWNLNNFKKAPIILFNHDKNKPIGRALLVKATDDGLWIKAEISKSSDPEISRIRDLVEEGILNAFSVGFDSSDEEQDQDGNTVIKSAELFEVSIVTLPMNQDSLFGLSTKSLSGLNKSQAIIKTLRAKGAMVAAAVQEKLSLTADNPEDLQTVVSAIAESAGVEPQVIVEAITGNLTPVPENVLEALSKASEIPLDELRELDQRDVANEAREGEDEPNTENEMPPQDDEEKQNIADESRRDGDDSEKENQGDDETLDPDEEKNVGGTLESKISDQDARGDRDEFLAQARQTNILLTQILEHVAGMSSKLLSMPPQGVAEADEDELKGRSNSEDEGQKSQASSYEKRVAETLTFAERLDARIKALSV